MEELYPIAVEVINSDRQGLQGQVKVNLLRVLRVGIEIKVVYQIIDDICFGLWNLFFILPHNLICVTSTLLYFCSELTAFFPVVILEILAIVFDLIDLLLYFVVVVKLKMDVAH